MTFLPEEGMSADSVMGLHWDFIPNQSGMHGGQMELEWFSVQAPPHTT
jgi:hypothetical protein